MNAFDKKDTNVVRPDDMKTPMIAVCALSDGHNRIEKLADVLEANGRTFDDFKDMKA